MDEQIVWKDEYNVGVETIDKEHKRLFKIINKLFAFGKDEKKGQWACQEGIKYFKEHVIKHFADEESYMASISYVNYRRHKQIHNDFRTNTLPALEKELEQTDYSPDAVDHFLGVCTGWLIGHTLTEDQAITGAKDSRWVNLIMEEEHEVMKKTIIQLVYDMFQLESHLVSGSYGGERFGKGVYYRLVYGTKTDEKCEIILVFEEKLLINTVGKVMGLKTNKLDTMLINATRYTAQQFVGRIKSHLPNADIQGLLEESLLTYEQFLKIYEQKKMQFSLLFDTGAGYLAYCAIAPHLLEGCAGTAINASNAMAEVSEYLKEKEKNEENPRKKVLIVDDSLTIREGMKQLLEGDYEVSLAKSGTAAIRTITLNRPDLILLDYEMPVCDGRQVLGMIRSEEEFADIPVFFLTGRVDQESVKNVISLKPEGYLSKQLKLEDIKMHVDKFFERKNT